MNGLTPNRDIATEGLSVGEQALGISYSMAPYMLDYPLPPDRETVDR